MFISAISAYSNDIDHMDDEQLSNAEEIDQEIKPINEIFICFDQEEFFEGHPENGANFDIIEHLAEDS